MNLATILVTQCFKQVNHRNIIKISIGLNTIDSYGAGKLFNVKKQFLGKTFSKPFLSNCYSMENHKIVIREPFAVKPGVFWFIVDENCHVANNFGFKHQNISITFFNIVRNYFWIGISVLPLVTAVILSPFNGGLEYLPYLGSIRRSGFSKLFVH